MGIEVHGRALGDDEGIGTAAAAAQTGLVLGKDVVQAILLAAAPVAGAERSRGAEAVGDGSCRAVVAVVLHHRRWGGREAVREAHVHVRRRAGLHGRERASEAGHVRRWKLEKPQDGQVQSPGRGRFFDGGNGASVSWVRSRTLLEDGDTSIDFSLRARPFMQRLSAAYQS